MSFETNRARIMKRRVELLEERGGSLSTEEMFSKFDISNEESVEVTDEGANGIYLDILEIGDENEFREDLNDGVEHKLNFHFKEGKL